MAVVNNEQKVRLIEERIGVTFPTTYRQFLIEHGTATISGYTILGIPKEVESQAEIETVEISLDLVEIAKSTSCPVCGQRKNVGKITCYPCYNQYSGDTKRQTPLSVWVRERLSQKKKREENDAQGFTKHMSVLDAFHLLDEKRPDLAQEKLVPVCLETDLNTDKITVLCMDLSQDPKDDAPLVLVPDIEQSEPVPHMPRFFSEWIAALKDLETLDADLQAARQRIRNRKNEVRKKELLGVVRQKFGQTCPLCQTRERGDFLTCQKCHEEWRKLEKDKLDFAEWVQGKLEKRGMNLPQFSHKGGKNIKHVHLRPQDWHSRIFRVADYVVGITAFRYSHQMSCLEVDAFWSSDLEGYIEGQAIRNLAIAILSEANALTGSLALAFTKDIKEHPKTGKMHQRFGDALEKLPPEKKAEAEKNHGRISCPIPQELVDSASQCNISLSQSCNGMITHQEGLEIFWAALDWPEHLQAKVDELEKKGYLTKQALANVIYSGIWSLQEAVWLFENAPRPEAILLGSDIPEDRPHYTESLHWGRSAYLVDLLRVKVSADLADGLSVEEREGSDCELESYGEFWTLTAVSDFNLPWMIKGSDPVLVEADEPILILSVPCQTTQEANDLEFLKSRCDTLKKVESGERIRCLLVGFEFSDLKYGMKIADSMKEYSKKLAKEGVYLMFSPYRLDLLNDEVENRMTSARKKRQFPARKTYLHLQLFEIQKERWQKPDLLYSVEDAKSATYWIDNKIDLRLGRIRFKVNCNCIERIAVQDREAKLIGEVTDQNSNIILSAMASESGITYPFVLPEEIPDFLKKTKGSLGNIKNIKGGLVAVVLPDRLSMEETIEPSPLVSKTHSVDPSFFAKVDPNSPTYAIHRPEEIAKTHQQIQVALKNGQPLAVSYLRHEIFVEVIREYVFAGHIEEAVNLRVIYNDGTEGCPFPLFSLPSMPVEKKPCGLFRMKVGSISMRHVALDLVTDGYLLQNIMISKRKLSSAEQEDYAFRRTWWFLTHFVDLVQHKGSEEIRQKEIRFRYLWNILKLEDKKSKGCELHIFQTGLVPATVGIYRAVLKFLQERRGELVVVPRLIGKKAGSKEVEATADTAYLPAEAWF